MALVVVIAPLRDIIDCCRNANRPKNYDPKNNKIITPGGYLKFKNLFW